MYERGSPMFGAQATSRTQSVWPSSTSSSTHACVSSENPQILTMLSHPALANRFTGGERAPPVLDTASSEPARAAGAHETALHPMAWASNTSAPHWPSSRHFQFSPSWKKKSSLQQCRTFESEDGDLAVRRGAGEDGAEFVGSPRHRVDWNNGASCQRNGAGGKGVRGVPDAVCSECSLIFAHPALAGCCSFQMITFPSYEHDARIWPNFGCAHATCHTGPVCLVGLSRMSGERDLKKWRGCYTLSVFDLRRAGARHPRHQRL